MRKDAGTEPATCCFSIGFGALSSWLLTARIRVEFVGGHILCQLSICQFIAGKPYAASRVNANVYGFNV